MLGGYSVVPWLELLTPLGWALQLLKVPKPFILPLTPSAYAPETDWLDCSLLRLMWIPHLCLQSHHFPGAVELFNSSLNCPFSHHHHVLAPLVTKELISSLPSQNMLTGCQRLSCHTTSGNSLPKVMFRLFPSESSDSSSKHLWDHLLPWGPSEFWCKQDCMLDHFK